jgi:fatty-acyl-CoA synthase
VTTFGDLPRAAALRWGEREALTCGRRRMTFRAIAAEVDRVAKGLVALGIGPGEKVAIWLVNCPEWIVAMFAIARIGAVHVPVNTRFRTDDVEYVLRQSNATTLITHDVSGPVDYLAMVRELAPELGQVVAAPGTRLGPALASVRLPDLVRVVVKADAAGAGVCTWNELIDAGRAVRDETLEARARAARPDDRCSSCTRPAPPASRRGSCAPTAR